VHGIKQQLVILNPVGSVLRWAYLINQMNTLSRPAEKVPPIVTKQSDDDEDDTMTKKNGDEKDDKDEVGNDDVDDINEDATDDDDITAVKDQWHAQQTTVVQHSFQSLAHNN
jgi:hypothetical protein